MIKTVIQDIKPPANGREVVFDLDYLIEFELSGDCSALDKLDASLMQHYKSSFVLDDDWYHNTSLCTYCPCQYPTCHIQQAVEEGDCLFTAKTFIRDLMNHGCEDNRDLVHTEYFDLSGALLFYQYLYDCDYLEKCIFASYLRAKYIDPGAPIDDSPLTLPAKGFEYIPKCFCRTQKVTQHTGRICPDFTVLRTLAFSRLLEQIFNINKTYPDLASYGDVELQTLKKLYAGRNADVTETQALRELCDTIKAPLPFAVWLALRYDVEATNLRLLAFHTANYREE